VGAGFGFGELELGDAVAEELLLGKLLVKTIWAGTKREGWPGV